MAARTIHCLPFSPNGFDSHVVSMVWINRRMMSMNQLKLPTLIYYLNLLATKMQ